MSMRGLVNRLFGTERVRSTEPRSSAGFTFAETLTALIVLTLLGGLVVTGVNTATTTYHTEQFTAQSEMLASTIDTTLSDPVRLMSTTKDADGNTHYQVSYNGCKVVDPQLALLPAADGKNLLYLKSGSDDTLEPVKLLNEGAYGDCIVESLLQVKETGGYSTVDAISLIPRSANPAINPTGRLYKDAVSGMVQISTAGGEYLTKGFEFYFVPLINAPLVPAAADGEAAGTSIATAVVDGIPDQVFTGAAITPQVAAHLGSVTLVQGEDCTVVFSNNVNAGDATVTIYGTGEYTGAVAVRFKIAPKDISGCQVAVVSPQFHTGSALTPAVSIVDPDRNQTLVQGVDYDVTYANNVALGTAQVTVTGKGNYTGTTGASFEIVEKTIEHTDISGAVVGGITSPVTHTGSEITQPGLTVKVNGTTLTAGTDYTVEYSNNVNVGTATIRIVGKGAYTGEVTKTFEIKAAGGSGGAPTIGAHPPAELAALAPAISDEWQRTNAYTFQNAVDKDGVSYIACTWNQVAIVYYNGSYYKAITDGGQCIATPLPTSLESWETNWKSAFSVADLTDTSKYRNYGYGSVVWERLDYP